MESEIVKAVAIAVGGLALAGIATFLLRAHFGKTDSHDEGAEEASDGSYDEKPPRSHSDKELAAYSSWGDLMRFSKVDKVCETHLDRWFGSGHPVLFSMAIPPIPAYALNRKVSELGTQAPPAALFARRSEESLKTKRSGSSLQSHSGSYESPNGSQAAFLVEEPIPIVIHARLGPHEAFLTPSPLPSRERKRREIGTPSPLRHAIRPESVLSVPPLPTRQRPHMTAADLARASSVRSPPVIEADDESHYDEDEEWQPSKVTPVSGNDNPDWQGYMSKLTSANQQFLITPTKPLRPDTTADYYKVKHGFLSGVPVLVKTDPPKPSIFPTPRRLNRTSPEYLFGAIKDKIWNRKTKIVDEESLHILRKNSISGPSTFAPNVPPGWSVHNYLTLHNAMTIPNPLIDHPVLRREHFRSDNSPIIPEAHIVAAKMEVMDRHIGWKRGGRNEKDEDSDELSALDLSV